MLALRSRNGSGLQSIEDFLSWPDVFRPAASLVDEGVNLSWADDAVVAESDVPGFSPEELDVSYANGYLTIAGDQERRHIRRTVYIGRKLDHTAIEATLTNGVLHVKMPFAEEERPRKIAVTVA